MDGVGCNYQPKLNQTKLKRGGSGRGGSPGCACSWTRARHRRQGRRANALSAILLRLHHTRSRAHVPSCARVQAAAAAGGAAHWPVAAAAVECFRSAEAGLAADKAAASGYTAIALEESWRAYCEVVQVRAGRTGLGGGQVGVGVGVVGRERSGPHCGGSDGGRGGGRAKGLWGAAET